MSNSPRAELAAILREGFGDHIEALRETLAAIAPGESLHHDLPPGTPTEIAFATVELLDSRGFLNDGATWCRLAEAAPALVDDIFELAASYGHQYAHIARPASHELPDRPFKDLDPYTEQDAAIFFGRRRTILALLSALRGAGSQVVIVFGPTGVGKSSILHAGVLPQAGGDFRGLYVRHTATSTLLASVQKALSSPDILTAWASREQESRCPIVVIVDQIEAAYTSTEGELRGERELSKLLDVLFAAENRLPVTGKLVLSVRKEWVTDLRRPLEQRGVTPDSVEVPRLDEVSIREIIRGPERLSLRQKYHLSYEPEVVDQITRDIISDERSPIAPTLQILLTQLWKQCPISGAGERVITLKQYSDLGRKEERFKLHIEQRLRHLDAGPAFIDRIKAGLALDLLFECTTQARTSQVLKQDELERRYGHDIGSLIDACVEARLLRREENDEAVPKEVSLTHDTVAPVVRLLFRESQLNGQRARRLLTWSMEAYTERGASPEWIPHLTRGELDVLHLGRSGMRLVTAEEQKIIEASRRHLDEEAAQATRIRRGRRLLRYLTAAVVLLTAAAGAYSVLQGRHTRELEAAQHVRELAVRAADTSARGQKELGALLAARAYHDRTPNNHTELSVIDATLRNALSANLLHSEASVTSKGIRAIALSLDGSSLIVAAQPSRLATYDVNGVSLRFHQVNDDGGMVYGLAHHPRLGWAAAGCDGVVRVWTTSIETPPSRRFERGGDDTSARCLLTLAIDETGEHILAGGASGNLYEWSADGGHSMVLTRHSRTINTVAYGPGGWIAAGDEGGIVSVGRRVYQEWPVFESHRPIYALAWQGSAIYAGGDSNMLWELVPGEIGGAATLKKRRAFELAPGGAPSTLAIAAVSGDSRIATAHVDGAVRLWRVPTIGGDLDSMGVIASHGHPVRAVQLIPGDDLLITASDDGSLRSYSWHTTPVAHLPVGLASRGSAQGERRLRVIDGDGNASLWRWKGTNEWQKEADPAPTEVGVFASPNGQWSVTIADELLTIRGPGVERTIVVDRAPGTATIDDAGRWVAAVFGANDLRLWSVAQSAPERIPSSAQDAISALAFSPDGEWLAVGGRSGDASLLRVLATRTNHMSPIDLESAAGRIVGLAFFDGALVALKDRGEIRVMPLTEHLALQACDSFAAAVSPEAWQLAVGGAVEPPCTLKTKIVPAPPPPPIERSDVLFGGCAELSSGPQCATDVGRPLAFWVPAAVGTADHVLVDGIVDPRAVIEKQRVSVLPTTKARSITLVDAAGKALFQLPITRPASSPEIVRAKAALSALKAAGNRFDSSKGERLQKVEEMERLATDAVRLCRQAQLLACQADASFVYAMRMIDVASDPGRALTWLDEHPLPDQAGASELGFDAAYARGTALLELSGRVALDAGAWLRSATEHGSHLSLGYEARGPSMQLYADTLYRLGHTEDAFDAYDQMAQIAPAADPCSRARIMHNRAALRLEILRDGGRHDAVADYQTALHLFESIADTEDRKYCFDTRTQAMLFADMALAACLQGHTDSVPEIRAKIDLALITSSETRGTLRELEACLRAIDG